MRCARSDDVTACFFDSDILNKKDVLWPPKKYVLIENKKVFNMVYFLLEKVIRCAQMPADC